MKSRNHYIIRILSLMAVIVALSSIALVSTARADKPVIYHLDLRYTEGITAAQCFDIRLVSVCMQGLVNREAPRLFISFINDDTNWLRRITEPGALCDGWEVREITYAQMITMFRGYINGLILFDSGTSTGAISSSLVAATVAGADGGIAIRKDTTSTIYKYLVNTLRIPVLNDLTGKFTGSGTIYQSTTASTGSAKCDAYIWAKEHYINTGKCDPKLLFYTLDLYGLNIANRNHTQLQNLDYAIMRKGFCFELSPWGDEIPGDDTSQPQGTDLATFKAILDACNTQTGQTEMIKVCGFPNWQYKYSNEGTLGGSHLPGDTEWEFIKILTAYNCYCEADAPGVNYTANASFYAGLLPEFNMRRYVQNPPPTYNDMVSRGLITSTGSVPSGNYVMIGMGDYDQVSWVMYCLANEGGFYNDTANKSSVYCNWGVDPNAIDRACVAFDYMYRNKTDHDFFFGWDSGAGYVNPTQLYGTRSPSGYPSGMPLWQKHCSKYYRALDYSITGWILNGSSSMTTACCAYYNEFSGDGIGLCSPIGFSTPTLKNNVPICSIGSIPNYSTGVHFRWDRIVASTVSNLKSIVDSYASSGKNHRFLDAYTFYYLLRYYSGGNNDYRETWVNDTAPRLMQAGKTYSFEVTVRNDGWDTWSESSSYRLGCAMVSSGATPSDTDYDSRGRFSIPGSGSVSPGESVTFTVSLTAPAAVGTYDLYCDIVRDGVTWFRYQYNLESVKPIKVVSDPSTVDTDGDGTPDLVEDANGTFFWHPDDNYAFGPATPAAPADTGAYTTSTSIRFSWDAVPDAIGYYCQIGTTPGGSDIYNDYLGNYLYKTLAGTDGHTYYCRIQAINNTGHLSAWSANSDGIAVDMSVPSTPAAPTDSGMYSGASVTFNWTAATDSTSGVAGYFCRIGTTSGGSDIYSGYVGNALTKTVIATAGKTLYCSICAKDNAGNMGSWSLSSDGVTVVSHESNDIASLKSHPDGTSVKVYGSVVTAVFNGFFYIEDVNRISGIKVVSNATVAVNQVVDVDGTMATSDSERYINAATVQAGANSSIAPCTLQKPHPNN
ncbi:MAG: hypothetical protein ABFD54_07200 [Armatimonadota bacterium]|nr:hypothetical protein [bacterium]